MNNQMVRSFLPRSKAERMVFGLRDFVSPSEVRVFRANPDGSKGGFLRVEPAKTYVSKFNPSNKLKDMVI